MKNNTGANHPLTLASTPAINAAIDQQAQAANISRGWAAAALLRRALNFGPLSLAEVEEARTDSARGRKRPAKKS